MDRRGVNWSPVGDLRIYDSDVIKINFAEQKPRRPSRLI
jgi:hypothetical protein